MLPFSMNATPPNIRFSTNPFFLPSCVLMRAASFLSKGTEPDSPRHRGRQQHHHHHQDRLDGADVGERLGAARNRLRAFLHEAAPADQRDHRPDLEREDDEETRHLAEEEAVVEIIEGALLEAAERAHQAGADPQHGGDGPPVVLVEQALQALLVEGAEQREAPAPDGAEADAEGEEVQGGEEPAQEHALKLGGTRATPLPAAPGTAAPAPAW